MGTEVVEEKAADWTALERCSEPGLPPGGAG